MANATLHHATFIVHVQKSRIRGMRNLFERKEEAPFQVPHSRGYVVDLLETFGDFE